MSDKTILRLFEQYSRAYFLFLEFTTVCITFCSVFLNIFFCIIWVEAFELCHTDVLSLHMCAVDFTCTVVQRPQGNGMF